MLQILDDTEKEKLQKKGYMIEHLLCLYSMVVEKTYIYDDCYPVFFSNFGEADVTLFGFRKDIDVQKCVHELTNLPINLLNIISPTPIENLPNALSKYFDWDFQINVNDFDFNMKGKMYKNIRYRLKQVAKQNYSLKISRDFTPRHTYILSRHMSKHNLDLWDFEELLSLERFFREHNHGLMMEVYKDNKLVGFDIVDFFEDNSIMAVPLGIYLDVPLISYFLMYENLKYAKEKGYALLDLGTACEVPGLRQFKENWFAKPKYPIYIQTLNIPTLKPNIKNEKLTPIQPKAMN